MLEFGGARKSQDPKQGITIGGFFSTSNNTHRSEIHYALLGTQHGMEKAQEWIKQFEGAIEASDTPVKIKLVGKISDGQGVDYDDGDSVRCGSKPLGDELEEPFGTEANDLPLDAMVRAIDRIVHHALGEPMPEPLAPEGYRLQ